MSDCFYDKVAEKFGSYHTGHKYSSEYTNGDPENIFKEKLIEVSGKEKLALDVGCADGRFSLSVAQYFGKIIAIDISKGMLVAARRFQDEAGVKNVEFVEQDVRTLPFEDGYFDVVLNRRGPPDFPQFFRVLKKGGYYLEIRIGEKDCFELKQTFGRGQGYGQSEISALGKDAKALEEAGFEPEYGENFYYTEYYPTKKDFDIFLQGVPIFEDYDSEKDRKCFEEYVKDNKTAKGIKLKRHRVVTVSKKN